MKLRLDWACAIFGQLLLVLWLFGACGGDETQPPNNPVVDAGPGDAGDGGPGACVAKTCAQLGAECGSAPDGCGGIVKCGDCSGGDQCGGGGPNKCGTNPCTPKTCPQLSASCGYASDGCAEAIDCGSCIAPETCGGAGTANQCGCVRRTCVQLGAECGTAPDGCGGDVDCGSCPADATCGGGGQNKCGTGPCTPKTCSQLGASCGSTSDGCSDVIDCGSCTDPDVCGGAGQTNQCGCAPKTCAGLGVSCGQAASGCGTTLQCGDCVAANAASTCTAGTCKLGSCNAGFGDCDGNAQTGCETNLNVDPNHCGSCSKVCTATSGTPVCINGVCGVSNCPTGKGDCDGDPSNGCETDITSSAQSCGFCNNACTYANGTGQCVSSSCQLASCNPGTGNCDSNPANGCETDTTSSTANCGSCGSPCNLPNAAAACSGGQCQLISCNPGWGDCDNNPGNGCETNLNDTTSACGSCSTDCANPPPPNTTGFTCVGGQCAITACAGGFSDSDGSYADGCECGDDGVSNVCASATVCGPNPVALGGSGSEGPHTILPANDQDYFVVNFAGSTSCAFHPVITLNDPSGVLRMDVTPDCSTATGLDCTEGGTSLGITTWEFKYSTACGSNLAIDPAKLPSGPASPRIRVYATAAPAECLSYTLTFSN